VFRQQFQELHTVRGGWNMNELLDRARQQSNRRRLHPVL
jgi:hypothetical protein